MINSLILAFLAGCATVALTGCGTDSASSEEQARPSRSSAEKPRSAGQTPAGAVTTPLRDLAQSPEALTKFKDFVAAHGDPEEKEAVGHLTSWKGHRPKGSVDEEARFPAVYPIIMIQSDLPAADWDAADDGDKAQSDLVNEQEGQAAAVAKAFDRWWNGEEKSTVQIFDVRGQLAGSGSAH
ncbi:hypothetical protein [Streptomyces sp. DSM 41493]